MQHMRLALLIPDQVIQHGIQSLITQQAHTQPEIVVFEQFEAFLEQSSSFDILLIDTSDLTIDQIVNRLKQLAGQCASLKVIVISNELKAVNIRRIMQVGAKGFIYRDDLSEVLLNSLDLVSRDVVTMSQQALQLLTTSDQLYDPNDLRLVDKRVLCLTAQGLTIPEIALELGISPRTIYRSRDRLREVLHAPTIENLIVIAKEQGLLDDCDRA